MKTTISKEKELDLIFTYASGCLANPKVNPFDKAMRENVLKNSVEEVQTYLMKNDIQVDITDYTNLSLERIDIEEE